MRLVRNYGTADSSHMGSIDGFTSDHKTETDCTSSHWHLKSYTSYKFGTNWPPKGVGVSWAGDNTPGFAAFHVSGDLGSAASHAYNKAVMKLQEEVYDKASTLTALAERRQTWSMVTNRLGHLLKGADLLQKGKFRSFLRHFGARPKRKDFGRIYVPPQKAAAYWIEYWFGWAPTAGDIHTAVNTLGAELPDDLRFEVGSSSFCLGTTSGNGGLPGVLRTGCEVDGRVNVHIRCRVSVNNYALFSLEKAGLMNPMATAWEMTPWSWLIDWATNVGQFLGQATRFAGLSITDIGISTVGKFTGTISWTHLQIAGATATKKRGVTLFRRKKLDKLPFSLPHVDIPKGSATRAATLASLLVLKFDSFKETKTGKS